MEKNQFLGNYVKFKKYYLGTNKKIINSLRNNNYWIKYKYLIVINWH